MQEGDVIDGRYRVEKILGEGGMGQVFRGHDNELNKSVAIKVLYRNTPDQVFKRFHNEAKALAQLNHPNILTVQHFGQAKDGQLYLVMDFIKGESLNTQIEKRGPQTFFDVLPIFEKICRGLRYAHMNNVLHRDIKPNNVMLAMDRSKDDSVKLVDFGLAKQVDRDFDLTKKGVIMGSPAYMSPESVRGQESDQRSDIYSLGCTFFEMITGRPPFIGDTAFHTMTAHIDRLPPTLAETTGKNFDDEVENFIQKCLKKNPDDRFQNMDELIGELDRVKNSLLAKKELSIESLASGIYASGTFLAEKMHKVDQKFKSTAGRVAIIGVIAIIGLATVWFQNSKTSKKHVVTRQADDPFSDLAHEAEDPVAEKRLQGVYKVSTSSGAEIVQDEYSPEKMCNLSGEMTDEQLKSAVKPYVSMKSFQFEDLKISDKAFKYLLALPMERLALVRIKITESLVNDIGDMPKLKFLRTFNCGDLPAGSLDRFKSSKLEAIDLDIGKHYEHPGLAIADFKALRTISLRKCMLDRSDVNAMVRALNVVSLTLTNCRLSQDALSDLHLAKKCRYFSAANMNLTPQQLEHISELPALDTLDLHMTNIDDTLLKKLHKCKSIRFVVLSGTAVTPTGAEVLKTFIPRIENIEMNNQMPITELY